MKNKLLLLLIIAACISCNKETIEPPAPCPEHYSGTDCNIQELPDEIVITKIVLTAYPTSAWDLTNGPDVFFYFFHQSVNIATSDVYLDATGTTLTWTNEITITDVTGESQIDFYDYDSPDPDDYMGGIIFDIYNATNDYPQTYQLGTADFTATLYLDYNF